MSASLDCGSKVKVLCAGEEFLIVALYDFHGPEEMTATTLAPSAHEVLGFEFLGDVTCIMFYLPCDEDFEDR